MELQRRPEAEKVHAPQGQTHNDAAHQPRNELALSQEEVEQAIEVSLFDDNKLDGGLHSLDPNRPNYRPTAIPEQE